MSRVSWPGEDEVLVNWFGLVWFDIVYVGRKRELTVLLHGLANADFHPRSFLAQSVDLCYELLLQDVLLHAHEGAEIEYAMLDVLELPGPASALIDLVEQITFSSVEDSLGEVGLGRDSVERTRGSGTFAWCDG